LTSFLLGLGCEPFLQRTIFFKEKDALPSGYEFLNPGDTNYVSGGLYLGMMECVIFFASLAFSEFLIAGGWLSFKLAAKWATWQHVIKMPETKLIPDDPKADLKLRNAIGSLQLARFLNGTLYNALCGLVGWFVAYRLLV
jgi:hypothetical protein